ncbi:hypothetical protein CUJ87_00305 [Paraburkholderia caledonica]|nr:hypothetical protein CUJ87_00305 [Paraburkholderia caledonica]
MQKLPAKAEILSIFVRLCALMWGVDADCSANRNKRAAAQLGTGRCANRHDLAAVAVYVPAIRAQRGQETKKPPEGGF